jgi:predicted metal-dependent hydrolase
MQLNCNGVEFKWTRGNWGYCFSQKRMITLGSQLVAFELALAEYVIVHELCHLVHSNHSAEFWAMVGKYYPDWKKARKIINNSVLQYQIN